MFCKFLAPRRAGAVLLFALVLNGPVAAAEYDLTIAPSTQRIDGKTRPAIAINGQVPGPLLRLREGDEAVIRVTNRLREPTAIHWHGILLPSSMDGVPGLSFHGIAPGQTYTYRFPVRQHGTYWYHSHSGLQEQAGVYAPLIIDPARPEADPPQRDYVLVLSDSPRESPAQVFANLKKDPDYYNYNQRTLFDFFRDVSGQGLSATLAQRRAWGQMRMNDADILDVSGATYTYLVNGNSPRQNWTALFQPGERVRLRLINAAAMTYFDLSIPGLPMRVVAADGNAIEPKEVDALRLSVAETYDVIVEPKEDRAYTVFAESMDRSGYARATLAPRPGMEAPIPALRPKYRLQLSDLGPAHLGGDGTGHGGHGAHAGHDMGAMADPFRPVPPVAEAGLRALAYPDLKAVASYGEPRPAGREIEIRLTGNMERYIWTLNGRKPGEAEPIRLQHGERVRLKLVNETMMNHPMHLHGLWMQLDNGQGAQNPLKHVVNVGPGHTVHVDVDADTVGRWAFHCHLMYHMASGMFREVMVEPAEGGT